jgi:hypothetical protein
LVLTTRILAHEAWGPSTPSAGQIVGDTNLWGFVDTNGTFSSVVDSGIRTTPYGINASGKLVGWIGVDSNGEGFLDSKGAFSLINPPGSIMTVAFGINTAGEVSGAYNDGTNWHGFTDTNGTFATIDVSGTTAGSKQAYGINDLGQVVGQSSKGAFIDTNGTFTNFKVAGASVTSANAINNSGTVVGDFFVGSVYKGFVYSGGSYTVFSVSGAADTMPMGIDSFGDMVGWYVDTSGVDHGFLATPNGSTTNGAPLPVIGGTLPGGLLLLGWMGRRITSRRKA